MSSDDRDCKDVVTSVRPSTRKGIWSERIVVLLLIVCLGSSLNLVIALHRRPSVAPPKEAIKPVTIAAEPEPKDIPQPDSAPPPTVVEVPQEPPPKPVEPPVDPTKTALAELEAATAKEREAASLSDRRADALEKSRQTMVAESDRWKRRESLIRTQIATLSKKAESIEQQLGNMELERDVLARERDALKAALTKVNRQSSFAVLPFKGANGTWQRPIILECSNGSVTLQPRGLTFSMLELNPHIHPKASIVVQAIAREMSVMESAGSPDGAPVVPYLIFIVRPDGIRPYYEARSRLEPLGIAFGYELIPQELKVEFPDLSDLSTWDGSVPLNVPPRTGSPGAGNGVAGNDFSNPASPRELSLEGFPGSGRIGQGQGGKADSRIGGQGTSGGDDPSDFIWPSRPGGGRAYGMGALERAPDSRGTRGTAGPLASSSESDGLGGPNALGSPRFRGSPVGQGGIGGASRLGSSGIYATPGDGSTQQTSPGSANLGRPSASGSNGFFPERPSGSGGDKSSTEGLGPLVGEWSGDGPPATPAFELSPTPAGTGGSGSEPASGIEPGQGRLGANGNTGSTSSGGSGLGSRPGGPTGGSRGRRDLFGSTIDPRTGAQGSTGNGTAAMPATGSTTGSGDGHESQNGSLTASGLSPSLLSSGGASGPSGESRGTDGESTGSASGSTSSNDRPTLSLGASGSSRSSSSAPSSGFGFGLPSSVSPSGGASGSGSSGSPSTSTSTQSSEESDDFIPKPDSEPKPPLRIEAPFEIVVDCQRDGIEILPGGNRITYKTLRAAASSKDKKSQDLLSLHLRALERKRALVDPMIRPVPRIKFIVEAGGDETYLAVRRQLLFSGLDWPMTVQIVEGQASRLLPRELW